MEITGLLRGILLLSLTLTVGVPQCTTVQHREARFCFTTFLEQHSRQAEVEHPFRFSTNKGKGFGRDPQFLTLAALHNLLLPLPQHMPFLAFGELYSSPNAPPQKRNLSTGYTIRWARADNPALEYNVNMFTVAGSISRRTHPAERLSVNSSVGAATCLRILAQLYPGVSVERAAQRCAEDPRLRLRGVRVCHGCAVDIARASGTTVEGRCTQVTSNRTPYKDGGGVGLGKVLPEGVLNYYGGP